MAWHIVFVPLSSSPFSFFSIPLSSSPTYPDGYLPKNSASASGSKVSSWFGHFLKKLRVAFDVDRRRVMGIKNGDGRIAKNLVP